MAALNFPNSPTTGQTFTGAGATWKWDGTHWIGDASGFAPIDSPVFTGDPQAPTPATADSDTSVATTAFVKAQGYATTASLGSYVLKAGDTMTGALTVTPSSVDGAKINGASAQARFEAVGTSADIGCLFTTKGAGAHYFYVASFARVGFSINAAPGSDTFLTATASASQSLLQNNPATNPINFQSDILLKADPTSALMAATKQYVDSKGGGGASVTVSDTPPASPAAGNLWWESDSGTLFIYYNDGNTSQWVAVATGGSGAAPLGYRVLLATLNPNGVNSIDTPNGLFDGTYDIYEIDFILQHNLSSQQNFVARMSINNGSSYYAGATDYGWMSVFATATGQFSSNTATDGIVFGFTQAGTGQYHCSGQMKLFRPSYSNLLKNIQYESIVLSTNIGSWYGNGYLGGSAAAITNLRFLITGGALFQPNSFFKIYGVK